MIKKWTSETLVRPTTGGISAAVAINNQMTPLRMENVSMDRNNQRQRQPRSYLFPKDFGQTKLVTTAIMQTEQAGKHDKK